MEIENIGNLEIDKDEGVVRVSVNPKIYPMEIIYGAAHAFTNQNYVLLDGDEEIEIVVELKPFETADLETVGRKFCNRLLSYQVYKQKSKENQAVRNLILYRALFTNAAISAEEKDEIKEIIEDPEDIAVPWEEKNDRKER